MATRSVLAYVNDNDEVRGTYVHWDGYPQHAIPAIKEMLSEIGFEGVKDWIEDGIAGGGFSTYEDEEPYNDLDPNQTYNTPLDSEDYGYLVSEDGVELAYKY